MRSTALHISICDNPQILVIYTALTANDKPNRRLSRAFGKTDITTIFGVISKITDYISHYGLRILTLHVLQEKRFAVGEPSRIS